MINSYFFILTQKSNKKSQDSIKLTISYIELILFSKFEKKIIAILEFLEKFPIEISCKEYLKIDASSGEIISWIYNRSEIINYSIQSNFWRPPTDNDLGNKMDKWAKV